MLLAKTFKLSATLLKRLSAELLSTQVESSKALRQRAIALFVV